MRALPLIGGVPVLGLALRLAIPLAHAQATQPVGPQPPTDAPTPDVPPLMTDIHDILPPVTVGMEVTWLVAVLVALAAAAILALAWWWWNKRKKARIIETIVPELPPEMTALRALDEISDVRRLNGKTFYFRLSAILRHYIYGRYRVGAPEMTTEEFLPCIDGLQMDNTLAQKLKRLCRAMDPVKFGAETAVENQMQTDLSFARELVKKTTPPINVNGQEEGGERNTMLIENYENSKIQFPNLK